MKSRSKNPFILFILIAALGFMLAGRVTAQPSLGLQFSTGQPTLSLTGQVGTVYSIQYATGVSPTNLWVDRTLLQAQGASNVWSDPSAPTPGQRFYRAVSVPAPADTNLVFIQPGTFTMGSPPSEALRGTDEYQHTVTISRGFWMEKFLVTQGDYLSVTSTNPSYFNGFQTDFPAPPGGTNYGADLTRPVETVNWYDATNYCGLRTQQERAGGLIPTNCAYRLPTESEWEYACRAGTTTAFYLGSSLQSSQANFDARVEYNASTGNVANSNGIYLVQTTPVGSYSVNGWGLYDMIGNLVEWCQDFYGPYPTGSVIDPQGAVFNSNRVFRGGRWSLNARYCRSASRDYHIFPTTRYNVTGFRVVLALVGQ